jgi:8-hydroxy-5-deazaflavin:NADPH oxidoreductase
MVQPQFPGGPPDMFLCGNDPAAKQTVGDICTAFGWPPVIDLGGIEMARYLEPLAMIWIVYGFWDQHLEPRVQTAPQVRCAR